MSIKGDVNELKQINTEIKRVSEHLRNLRKMAKEIETRIINYLSEKEQPGLKYKGNAIILENKLKREHKKNKDKQEDALKVLKNYGIENPDEVLSEIMEARKGEKIEQQKIKFKNIEKY